MNKLPGNERSSKSLKKWWMATLATAVLLTLFSNNAKAQDPNNPLFQAKQRAEMKDSPSTSEEELFACTNIDHEHSHWPQITFRSEPCMERDTIRSVGIDFSFQGTNLGFGEKWEAYTDTTNVFINQVENTGKWEGTNYHNKLISTNTIEIIEGTPMYDYFIQNLWTDDFLNDLLSSAVPVEVIDHLITIHQNYHPDIYSIALNTTIGSWGVAFSNVIIHKEGNSYLLPSVNIIKCGFTDDRRNSYVYSHEVWHWITRKGNVGGHMNESDWYPPNFMNWTWVIARHILPETIAQAQEGIPDMMWDNGGAECETTGIEDIKPLQLTFGPNPNNDGQIYFQVPAWVTIMEGNLIDMQWRAVSELTQQGENQLSFDNNGLPTATYVLHLRTTEGQVYTAPIHIIDIK